MALPRRTCLDYQVGDANKRKYERVLFQGRVALGLSADGVLEQAVTRDLSLGGVFVQCDQPYAIGAALELVIDVPGAATPLVLQGTVAWRRDDAGQAGKYGIGVSFVRLTDEGQQQIGRLVATAPRGPPPWRFDMPNLSGPPSERVIGIDLGTTKSCASYVDGKMVRTIPNAKGHSDFPSVLYLDNNTVLVGQAATDRLATHPHSTIYGSKRLLGRPYASKAVQEAMRFFNYTVRGNAEGNAVLEVDGRPLEVVEVAARTLYDIRQYASAHLREHINKAVICVPAYFTGAQREATKRAAERAGFEVKQLVNEPVAAAVAYGVSKDANQRLFVYDFGGGTFDISLVELSGNVFEVLATDGDAHLGGVDVDNALVDYLMSKMPAAITQALLANATAMLRLRLAVNLAKHDLSEQTQVILDVPFLLPAPLSYSLRVALTRDELEAAARPLVARSMDICRRLLEAAGATSQTVGDVLFVGGQTRMPLIRAMVVEFFGKAPRKGVHPQEAVAIGAGLVADSLDKFDAVVLLDIVSKPIGIGLPGGRFHPVVGINSKLPVEKRHRIRTTEDGQRELTLAIYQGLSANIVDCDYLGSLTLTHLPSRPKGEVEIELTFIVTLEGFMHLVAKNLLDNSTQEIQLSTSEPPAELTEALAAANRAEPVKRSWLSRLRKP